MAPIESSQRALSIGAIGFAQIDDLNIKIHQNSNQIRGKGRQIKSNHVFLRRRQIKSNHVILKMCQIKSECAKIA
jgi:hypothetical protein